MTRLLGATRQVALTVGAVVGAVCILVTVTALVFNVRPLVFRSGSMSPTIGTGALAIAHSVDASSLRRGQIVSVPTASGERVTHRIQSVEHQGDKAVLVLKGDANDTPDASPYVVTHADKVLFHVPLMGYAVGWLTGPIGLFLLGLYAAFLLSVMLRPNGGSRAGPPSTHGTLGVVTLALVVGAGLVPGTALLARTSPTLAAWTNPGSVSGTTVGAYTVPTTTLTCAKSGSKTVFTWTAVTGATGYTITFTGGTAKAPITQTGTSYTDTSPSTNRVATVVVNRNFGSVTWTSVASNSRKETSNNGQCA